jgi:hypothetical protein
MLPVAAPKAQDGHDAVVELSRRVHVSHRDEDVVDPDHLDRHVLPPHIPGA